VNIHLGRLDLARKALDRAAHADQPIHLGTLSATAGLLAYRLGDVDTGRALYEESLRIFRASGYSDSAELASLYWMLEQIRLPLTESQRANIRSQAQRRVSLRGTDFQYLAERVLKGL
jgi:tetratricopeptide (TPR) repeat protein